MTDSAILWTAEEAACATEGQAIGGKGAADWEATGVSIDSRTLRPGDLFCAIQGPNHDGHDYLADAWKRGASASVTARRPGDASDDAPLLMVGDTLEALRALGRAARARTEAKVIAVTGSVGKTGTKEALRHVLAAQGRVHASEGSLNNHWGLPLSLARMPRDTDYGIFEMGMNHAGEITPLTQLARPHVALVTAIEGAHREFFDSLEAIADAKAEIFEGVEPGGWAVIKRDMPFFHRMAARAKDCGVETIIGFGAHDAAEVRLVGSLETDSGTQITALVDGKRVDCSLPIPGSHWVMNSLGVLAAVFAAGGDAAAAAESLNTLRPMKGRGERHSVSIPGGAFTLIDESYNASPASMRAAFEVLARAIPGKDAKGRGRRIAVLGDMLELGEGSGDAHASLAGPLEDFSIDLVFTAGSQMARLADELPAKMSGGHENDSKAVTPVVVGAVRPGDVVTVKGSAGSRMGEVVTALMELDQESSRGEQA